MLMQILIATFIVSSVFAGDLENRLGKALEATIKAIDALANRWQIEKYPKFLESAALSHTSWEVLKLKFQYRILKVANSNFDNEEMFVISFMGSSVTAGHDSPFNKSFPVIVGEIMRPALAPLSLKVVSRNAAMGNNPCMPYDVCVRAFAGSDADIVHWEQSYNCMTNSHIILEQFIRQSIALPKRPVVVFSDSATPNWGEKDCNGKPTDRSGDLSNQEKQLVKAWKENPIDLVSNLNKGEVGRWDTLYGRYTIIYQ